MGKFVHGLAGRGRQGPEYICWGNMRNRCRESSEDREHYFDRGITVCERWNSFALFFADMGPRPTPRHSIDRKNNNLGYQPENCRWATRAEQTNNTRQNVLITAFGETKNRTQWLNDPRCVVSHGTLRGRLARGMDPETAMTAGRMRTGPKRKIA